MGIKAVLDTEAYETLDEELQALYTEDKKSGQFILDAEGIDDLPQVRGLVSTLKKYKEIAPDNENALKKRMLKLKQFEAALGDQTDPDEVQAALEELEELKAKGDGGDGDEPDPDVVPKSVLESRTTALTEKHTKEMEKKDTEIGGLTAFVEDLLIDRGIDAALADAESIEKARKGAKALIRQEYSPEVVRDDNATGKDRFRAIVRTDMGDVDLSDFVATWTKSDEADPYMPASGNRGSGAGGDRATRTGKNPFTKEHRDVTEQGRLVRDEPEQARQLIAAAGKDPKSFGL